MACFVTSFVEFMPYFSRMLLVISSTILASELSSIVDAGVGLIFKLFLMMFELIWV